MIQHHLRAQLTSFYCGPAVLQIVLGAHGINRSQYTLAKEANTSSDVGTATKDLVKVLRDYELLVTVKENCTLSDLREALIQGKHIIVCFTERHNNEGHYAVVHAVGDNTVEFLDPSDAEQKESIMDAQEFVERWKDPLYTRSHRFAAIVG